MQYVCAILSSVACPAVQYFSTLSHKRNDFRKKKKKLLSTKCVFIFSTTFLWNILHSKKKWTRYDKKCIMVFLSDFNETWIFPNDFRKIVKYQISWKSDQWEPKCSVRTGGQTDRHYETNSRFSQFCEPALKRPVNFSLEDPDDNVTDTEWYYDRRQTGAFEIQRLHADILIYAISSYLISISLGFKEIHESVLFIYCG
jgi:hypothetical protein